MLHDRSSKSRQQADSTHDVAREHEAMPMPRILAAMKRQRSQAPLVSTVAPAEVEPPSSSSPSSAPSVSPQRDAPTVPADTKQAVSDREAPAPQNASPALSLAAAQQSHAGQTPTAVTLSASAADPAAVLSVVIPADMRINPVSLDASESVPPLSQPPVRRLPVRPVVLAVALGTIVFIGFTHGGRDTRAARPFLSQIDSLAEVAGLGIAQVSLKGHRYTPDGDIFDALKLDAHRTMLSFSITDARARLEALPWIHKASILRKLPDQLIVEVSERTPFAVWRAAGKHQLIDDTGRVLALIKPDGADELPLVIGDGAATRAKALLKTIAAYPKIAKRLVAVEWVGGRRWTLWFAGGPKSDLAVHLPQNNHEAAIAKLARLNSDAAVFDRALTAIDLRIPQQMTLRPVGSDRRGQARSRNGATPGRT